MTDASVLAQINIGWYLVVLIAHIAPLEGRGGLRRCLDCQRCWLALPSTGRRASRAHSLNENLQSARGGCHRAIRRWSRLALGAVDRINVDEGARQENSRFRRHIGRHRLFSLRNDAVGADLRNCPCLPPFCAFPSPCRSAPVSGLPACRRPLDAVRLTNRGRLRSLLGLTKYSHG